MLTGDLLRARGTRQEVRPGFIPPDQPRHQERAQALVRIAREAVEARLTRGELEDRVEEEIVGTGVDHRLARGLARVVLDRCEFDTESPLDPVELRALLFAHGPVSRQPGAGPTAEDVYRQVGEQLQVAPEVLKRSLFADLKMNQVLRSCDVPGSAWVLHRYNVALVQGLLLQAGEVQIHLQSPAPERARQLFRLVKFHQLMHRVEAQDGGYRLVLDGPASILRQSTRYGHQLALFFPALPLQTGPWSLEAQVRWKGIRRTLKVSHKDGLVSHLPDHGAWVSREEEWLEERFAALSTPWTLTRGGPLLNLGGDGVLCPDYTLRNGDRVALLEVVGTWRRAWLERKLELLKRHAVPHLFFAVSRNLLGDNTNVNLEGLGERIVPFSKVIPARDVVEAAERFAVSDRPG